MRKINKTVAILLTFLIFSSSCKDFLNIVPDDVPTIDHAFSNRKEAEKYLYGCYAFSPSYLDVAGNPALTGGGEVWLIPKIYSIGDWILVPWRIAKGEQNTNAPLADFWNSNQYASSGSRERNIFTGIRDCNIFLEEISRLIWLNGSEINGSQKLNL